MKEKECISWENEELLSKTAKRNVSGEGGRGAAFNERVQRNASCWGGEKRTEAVKNKTTGRRGRREECVR